jgi:hypothetical protein
MHAVATVAAVLCFTPPLLFARLSLHYPSLSLGAEDFKNLQELNIQDFVQQVAGE